MFVCRRHDDESSQRRKEMEQQELARQVAKISDDEGDLKMERKERVTWQTGRQVLYQLVTRTGWPPEHDSRNVARRAVEARGRET